MKGVATDFIVWKVVGEATHGDGGGEETRFYITPGSCLLPDLSTDEDNYGWYFIESIERVAEGQ